MKKVVSALAAGLLLVAGQAAAANNSSAVARVGDRVGVEAGEASEFAGVPLPVLIVGAAILVAAAVAISDDGDSD